MGGMIPMEGRVFGRLTVLCWAGSWGKTRKKAWLCDCQCGKRKVFCGEHLRRGTVLSCGCLQRAITSARRKTHGATLVGKARWPEYGIWEQMKNRCYREASDSFRFYGARGISVCDRWRFGEGGKSGFECFIDDMGRRPSHNLSLDRRENNGNYCKDNCRWATKEEQSANRRPRGPNLKPYPKRQAVTPRRIAGA